jgi:hypothetical protein
VSCSWLALAFFCIASTSQLEDFASRGFGFVFDAPIAGGDVGNDNSGTETFGIRLFGSSEASRTDLIVAKSFFASAIPSRGAADDGGGVALSSCARATSANPSASATPATR